MNNSKKEILELFATYLCGASDGDEVHYGGSLFGATLSYEEIKQLVEEAASELGMVYPND